MLPRPLSSPRRRPRHAGRAALAALVLAAGLGGARGQGVTDSSGAALGPAEADAVLALVARQLRTTDARVTGLRRGRGGAICGAVEVRNRMGDYTGPRPFVADLDAGFAGRLPEGPELRSPASAAEYRELDRARQRFARDCADG